MSPKANTDLTGSPKVLQVSKSLGCSKISIGVQRTLQVFNKYPQVSKGLYRSQRVSKSLNRSPKLSQVSRGLNRYQRTLQVSKGLKSLERSPQVSKGPHRSLTSLQMCPWVYKGLYRSQKISKAFHRSSLLGTDLFTNLLTMTVRLS